MEYRNGMDNGKHHDVVGPCASPLAVEENGNHHRSVASRSGKKWEYLMGALRDTWDM